MHRAGVGYPPTARTGRLQPASPAVRVAPRLFRLRSSKNSTAHPPVAAFLRGSMPHSATRGVSRKAGAARHCEWSYANRPFPGPRRCSAYLSRYTTGWRSPTSGCSRPTTLRHLPLEGLPVHGQNRSTRPYAGCRRVHTPIPMATLRRLSSHPPQWLLASRRREHLARARELLHVVPAARTAAGCGDRNPTSSPPSASALGARWSRRTLRPANRPRDAHLRAQINRQPLLPRCVALRRYHR